MGQPVDTTGQKSIGRISDTLPGARKISPTSNTLRAALGAGSERDTLDISQASSATSSLLAAPKRTSLTALPGQNLGRLRSPDVLNPTLNSSRAASAASSLAPASNAGSISTPAFAPGVRRASPGRVSETGAPIVKASSSGLIPARNAPNRSGALGLQTSSPVQMSVGVGVGR